MKSFFLVYMCFNNIITKVTTLRDADEQGCFNPLEIKEIFCNRHEYVLILFIIQIQSFIWSIGFP